MNETTLAGAAERDADFQRFMSRTICDAPPAP
jgi:hypothetical protein